MAQNFLRCDRDQQMLMPPDLRDWLDDDHLAWFVIDFAPSGAWVLWSASDREGVVESRLTPLCVQVGDSGGQAHGPVR
jgi:hypothetical protein